MSLCDSLPGSEALTGASVSLEDRKNFEVMSLGRLNEAEDGANKPNLIFDEARKELKLVLEHGSVCEDGKTFTYVLGTEEEECVRFPY